MQKEETAAHNATPRATTANINVVDRFLSVPLVIRYSVTFDLVFLTAA